MKTYFNAPTNYFQIFFFFSTIYVPPVEKVARRAAVDSHACTHLKKRSINKQTKKHKR